MSESDVVALALHRPRIAARRRFDERLRSGARIEPDEVYDLALLETGDAAVAGDRATRWAEQMLRTQEAPP